MNAELYKIEASGKFGVKDGYGKAKVVVPHNDPFILEGNYKTDLEGMDFVFLCGQILLVFKSWG